MIDDLIGRAEAQTAIQFAARRYTVAHEAHGEGQVVWSDNLINVTDAMNVLRDLPSAQSERKGTRLSTVCLLCKKPAVTFNTEDDIPYTNYSYCEDCLRKGLKLLREQKKICKNSKAAIEKAVAVEAISDELMSRFDISATYAYDVAESAVNRIEVMAKKMDRGEQR